MKISILYFSKTGKTKRVAEIIKEGINTIDDIEVKTMNLDEIDYKFLDESKAVLFGTPTYYANMTWQMKKWIDESKNCNLEGKLGAVFATAHYIGGGANVAMTTMINHFMVKGMLMYSGGSALGQPYIHLGHVSIGDGNEEEDKIARIFGERIALKAKELFK
ncbi:flavodoxin family protein [Clostridium weizhouense]|uniref:Flavodoxin domain-containing protein n=1 Tax=Clostridium weizhouense TaxID=2859781 RepID=A0ABS7AKZ7_9CLOT|nr:flavodoxin domain-containing protein [Clostridium weizhouense]MBW6409340.1 flavodoxin domain-containing protein [Clostridium weizhouense]